MPECEDQPITADPMIIVGNGPFFDCGMGPTGLRAPSPTALPHAFGDWPATTELDDTITCFLDFTPQGWWDNPWPFSLPDIPIANNDRIIHNSADGSSWTGDVVFYGQRVKWINEPGVGSITGEYICAPGADMIEVDGECICPAPEPGVSLALSVGLVLLAVFARRRKA